MHYEVDSRETAHFHENHSVSFPDIFREEEVAHLLALPPGRDFWRRDPLIAAWLKSHWTQKNPLTVIAHELTKKRPLRLLFDERLPAGGRVDMGRESFQGCLLLVLLSLESKETLFLAPHLTPITTEPSYLIAIGEVNSLYVANEEDPQRHYLRDMGYAPGDRLNNKDFPLIYR